MKSSIGSNALNLTTAKIITMSISIVIAMLLSRFRSLEEFGTYSQLLLVVNLVTTVFMLGLPNSINYFYVKAENIDDKEKFVSTYYTLSTILSFLSGLTLVLATPFIADFFDNEIITDFYYVLAIFPWTRIILSSIENILIVSNRTSIILPFRILNSIFLLGTIIIVKVLELNFYTFMVIYVGGEVLFAISVYIIVKSVIGKLRISMSKNFIKTILKFSVPIGLASVVGILSIEMDKLFIGKFFNAEQFAIYTNAAREMPVTIIASSITAVLMPQLVSLLNENKNKEAIELWGNATIISYIAICFFAASLFVFAPEVMSLLYSDKYLPGVPIFRIYSIVLLLRCTYFGMILNSIGKTKFILYSSIGTLGLNIVLNYFFYLAFGIIGPAIATLISISFIQILQLKATSRQTEIPFKDVFPWGILGGVTVLNIIMSCMFALLKQSITMEIMTGEIIESIILGFIWGTIYLVIMRKLIKKKWTSLNHDYNSE